MAGSKRRVFKIEHVSHLWLDPNNNVLILFWTLLTSSITIPSGDKKLENNYTNTFLSNLKLHFGTEGKLNFNLLFREFSKKVPPKFNQSIYKIVGLKTYVNFPQKLKIKIHKQRIIFWSHKMFFYSQTTSMTKISMHSLTQKKINCQIIAFN